MILLGLRVARRGRRLERAGVQTSAIVVEAGPDDEGMPFAVVEYRDQAHARHRKRLSGHGRESPAVGSGVTIVYDPAGPRHADWEYNVPLWRGLALAIVGAGITIVVLARMPGWAWEPRDRPALNDPATF